MHLNNLRAFVTVVETRSFNEAAKRLSVSQPAVTQRIQTLDEHFKTKLLRRDTGGVYPTPQGEIVYQHCVAMLQTWAQLESQVLGDNFAGKITVGSSTIPSEYFLPKWIKKFKNTYKDVAVQINIAGSSDVFKWLVNGSVDLIVTGKPETQPDLVTYPLLEDELKIIVPVNDHHFTGTSTLADLAQFDWIIREPHSGTRLAWEQELVKRGLHPSSLKISGQMGSTEAIISAVEAGIGISVISSFAAGRAEKYGRVKILDVPDFNVTRTFFVSTMRDKENIPINKKFIDYLISEAQNK